MSLIELEIQSAVAHIRLNRPDKRNALSSELVRDLHDAVRQVSVDDAVRAVVLSGNGPAFCAGADLGYIQQLADFSILENKADSAQLEAAFRSIYTCPKPVIAKVHGPAIAGGCGLATVCDFVVAARSGATFGYSEVRIGFIPAIVMVYLIRKLGDTRARRLILSAEFIGAEEAEHLGLISHVVDDDKLDTAVDELAAKLVKNSASALALSKEMLNALQGMSLDAGLQYAVSMNALARMTDDCQAGIAGFLKKSK